MGRASGRLLLYSGAAGSVLISACKYFDAANISIWQIIIWPGRGRSLISPYRGFRQAWQLHQAVSAGEA